MIINNTIVTILYKLVNEQALSSAEQASLDDWLGDDAHKKAVVANLMKEDLLLEEVRARYASDDADAWLTIMQQLRERGMTGSAVLPPAHRVHFLKASWFRYAAVFLLIIGVACIYFLNKRAGDVSSPGNVMVAADLPAGGNKAILTIGSNKPIDLSSDKPGIAVGKSITYTDGEKIADADALLTLATPRGGQYQALLPDGSRVWLNAVSSIKFPSAFNGDVRAVEVTGEVYMEIAGNSRQAFYVKANGMEVQVLGTSFDISAYPDEESVRTTLIEGSVKIIANGKRILLKPGQQAIVNASGVFVQTANTEDVLAWKNGVFNFNNVDVQGMMRQLARWYDLEVVYEGNIPEKIFEGKMQRNIPLSSALKILELNKIKFRMEGRKIIVLP